MKIAVVGSRSFDDFDRMNFILNRYKIDVIISGGAIGADSLARKYALDHKISIAEFLPEWKRFGKQAGFIRNKLIVNACEGLIAFWDDESRGTKHSIDLARSQNKLLKIVHF